MTGLTVENLTVKRGGLPVVRETSLAVDPGTITVLLGANGAGKTTLLEGLAGAVKAESGSITLGTRPLDGLGAYERARAGFCLIEQGRAVFRDLTVEENLAVACADGADAAEILGHFPELKARWKVKAGLLSGGEQQMLLIGRALLQRPSLLAIDEMSLGLAPIIVKRLMKLIRDLAREGLSILLVEQFAALALSVGSRAYVLSGGRIVYNGDCRTLQANPDRLHALYFGE